ncbi:MAG: hypothetical protein JWN73_3487 [Betaproteobacteria bacterium]|nr:hypothetical protein [Betaproteobacteria bacterium]
MSNFRVQKQTPFTSMFLSACAAAVLGLGSLHAPAALAAHGSHGAGHSSGRHSGGGHWHGGHWRGGVVIGPAFADPFWGAYDWLDYPPAAYVPPVPETYVEADPATLPKAPPRQLSQEQREQRLNEMCAQHVFKAEECATRRAELLREM